MLAAASALHYLAHSDIASEEGGQGQGQQDNDLTSSTTFVDTEEIQDTIPHLLRTLRTLHSTNDESINLIYSVLFPLIKNHISLWRAHIEEFLVLQSDPTSIKLLKVELLELLVDRENVGLVVRELTNYVRWGGLQGGSGGPSAIPGALSPGGSVNVGVSTTSAGATNCLPLVARSIKAMGKVALSVESRVVDECLRDMVRMLDSRCELQASEAVVALRTLLQQTASSSADNKGDVSMKDVSQPNSPSLEESTTAPATEGAVGPGNSDSKPTTLSAVAQDLDQRKGGEKIGLRNSRFWLQVVSQLIQSLEDLTSPVARASVIWIIGEYRSQVPEHSPDAVRSLAKSFRNEAPEVKYQALSLGFKIWGMHYFKKELGEEGKDGEDGKEEGLSPKDSKEGVQTKKKLNLHTPQSQFAKRLGEMVSYMCKLALQDEDYDLRDMGRLTLKLMEDASKHDGTNFASVYASVFAGKESKLVPSSDALQHTLEELSKMRAGNLAGKSGKTGTSRTASPKAQQTGAPGNQGNNSDASDLPYIDRNSWLLYSLARVLDASFPGLPQTYHPLPLTNINIGKQQDDTLRDPPQEAVAAIERRNLPSAFSSDVKRVGGTERAVQPSMIDSTAVPKIESLGDLDSFYADTGKTTVRFCEKGGQTAVGLR